MKTIFNFELKYWLKNPFTWFCLAFFFLLPWMIQGSMSAEYSSTWQGKVLNSASGILKISNFFVMLIYFILPGFVGMSLFRDYHTRMHSVLYAYPLNKGKYLFAKFFSSFLMVFLCLVLLHLGLFLGSLMPWANPDLIQPFRLGQYLEPMLIIELPNVFLLSVCTFAVVALSRNVYAGFITVFVFYLFQKISGSLIDYPDASGFLDPFGLGAMKKYVQYWTVEEYNNESLPVSGLVLYNRLFWLALAGLILRYLYQKFAFVQEVTDFSFGKKKSEVPVKENFRNITRVIIPKVSFDYSWIQQFKNAWKLSNVDFQYIVKSKAFSILILVGFGAVAFMVANGGMRFGTQNYPLTRKMLDIPLMFFSILINVMTFLYAGLIINRSRDAGMMQLTDVCPIPNGTLLVSKFIALVKMQGILLTILMLVGVCYQTYMGYFNYEFGQYFFELYIINLLHFSLWAMLSIFTHTLLKNTFLAFFLLILFSLGMIGIIDVGPEIGLDILTQTVFRYNASVGNGAGIPYSDLAGYGPLLKPYFFYKLYWMLGGSVLLCASYLLWRRGMPADVKERITLMKARFSSPYGGLGLALFVGFLCFGFTIFYQDNIARDFYTNQMRKPILLEAEKKYSHYQFLKMPKIESVEMEMNLFPNERTFDAKGKYSLTNKTDEVMDTLTINYLYGLNHSYDFNRPYRIHSHDEIADFANFDVVVLEKGLQPGEQLEMTFEMHTDKQGWMYTSDWVKSDGTFINDEISPRIGYWLGYARRKLNMSDVLKNAPHPLDSVALQNSFDSNDEGMISFEATVSTSAEQTAFAPGQLQREWKENGRNYFHYKTAAPISHSYLFTSGEYAVARDKWQDIDLEVYYYPSHGYNAERMLEGLRDGLIYCSENFTPYQFKQVRIIEFAQVGGASAHGYPSVIPFGEEAGFIAHIHEGEDAGVDFAYGGAVHEVAHQWWGHQIKPMGRGAKSVNESIPEYINVMMKKKHKGIKKARDYMNEEIHRYLKGRAYERGEESPLVLSHSGQNYIHYPKGLKVFYAMQEYIGEEKLNKAIGDYAKEVAFLKDDYTTSFDLLDKIRAVTPDSLQYLIKDWFETVTIYDNQMLDFETTELENGKYEVKMDFIVSKYRTIGKGEKVYEENGNSLTYEHKGKTYNSLPMSDYIEIGIFGVDGKELYLQKHKITDIHNEMTIVVGEKPVEVGVDPHILMIDVVMEDNRME